MKKILFISAAVTLLSSCGGEYPYGPMGGPGGGWGHMMGYGYGGMLMWIIFIAIFGVLIYFLMQAAKGRGRAGETPLEILKKRYAKGEIAREEYERMKKDLEG
ncbi:MAG TPA: SHOCT domain-containing protein [Syntrophales bacterium]|jgi:putative membrane protein